MTQKFCFVWFDWVDFDQKLDVFWWRWYDGLDKILVFRFKGRNHVEQCQWVQVNRMWVVEVNFEDLQQCIFWYFGLAWYKVYDESVRDWKVNFYSSETSKLLCNKIVEINSISALHLTPQFSCLFSVVPNILVKTILANF